MIQEVKIFYYSVESSHNYTNAYMLMYRKVGQQNLTVDDAEIPDYIADMIDKEETAEHIEKEVVKEKKAKMQVKVFYGDKARVVNTNRTDTYAELLEIVLKEFEIQGNKANYRLRSYNFPNHTMQETYTGKELVCLEELRIYPQKALALESKTDSQVFEEYDPANVQIKIILWKPQIVAIDEVSLKPILITIKRTSKLGDLLDTLQD